MLAAGALAAAGAIAAATPTFGQSVDPGAMPRVGAVDERYQSYNVEMLEVTGGKFWRPYGPELTAALREPAPAKTSSGDTPAGMNPALY